MTNKLTERLDRTFDLLEQALEAYDPRLHSESVGIVSSISKGIATVAGLPGVAYQELIRFPGGLFGLAFDLRREEIGVLLLGDEEGLHAGDEVHRTLRVLDVPVGDALIGRVVDPLGRPLDRDRPVSTTDRWPVERPAPTIMDRAPVQEPLQTGIKVIDALIPIGRGQRELIMGDRQTGKTTIAIDSIFNQADKDVLCIYCAIGQRDAAVARVIDDLREHDAMDYTLVMVAGGQDAPGLKYVAPYAATTMAEYFAENGQDVLIIYDDLTQHARAYRELSLLLRRPPGREAYPGDIFYIHSRLLERATHFSDEMGGGSLTALPIIETQAQNISAYIPTNLISITDGQIYLDPTLFRKGILPAVSAGRSVSRVGGKAQLPAYQTVAGDLRLAYSQFEELESFARFGTRLDEETRHTLERGRRVREVLKQRQYAPIPVAEQIAVLLATTRGVYDRLPPEKIGESNRRFRHAFRHDLPEIYESIQAGKALEEEEQEQIISLAESAIGKMYDDNDGEFDGND